MSLKGWMSMQFDEFERSDQFEGLMYSFYAALLPKTCWSNWSLQYSFCAPRFGVLVCMGLPEKKLWSIRYA